MSHLQENSTNITHHASNHSSAVGKLKSPFVKIKG